jgi:glycosyltransferase involved in cell wall biosynthesis
VIDNTPVAASSTRTGRQLHPDSSPVIGVVLVTYRSADDLPTFLASLPDAMASYPFEVVAVDNASTDDSVRIVREFGAQVAVNASNVGCRRRSIRQRR